MSQHHTLLSTSTLRLPITLLVSLGGVQSNLSTTVQLALPRLSDSETSPILSTFLSNTGAPSYALYTPPKNASACSSVALLALHGAGVDPATSPSWTSSIKQRDQNWIVWPLGLSAWGYDWHGASVKVSYETPELSPKANAPLCRTSTLLYRICRMFRRAGKVFEESVQSSVA
jgi:poly(3-hydroxybutyrate) depolymerase